MTEPLLCSANTLGQEKAHVLFAFHAAVCFRYVYNNVIRVSTLESIFPFFSSRIDYKFVTGQMLQKIIRDLREKDTICHR